MTERAASAGESRVAVIGARGRMGREVCRALEEAPGLVLGPRIDLGDGFDELETADVAVVFSVPDVAVEHVLECVRRGVHVVVGTSGWTDERLARVRAELVAQPHVGVLIAANFALGAVLLMRFAAMAAPHFESVEIIELHHPNKVDAPSGTAAHTAQGVAAARRDAGLGAVPDATTTALPGARGAEVDGNPGALGAAARPGGPRGGPPRWTRRAVDPCATTPSIGPRSCPACCWAFARCPPGPA